MLIYNSPTLRHSILVPISTMSFKPVTNQYFVFLEELEIVTYRIEVCEIFSESQKNYENLGDRIRNFVFF